MHYEDYLGFVIISDPDYFDMFAVKGRTIKDYIDSRFRFKTVEAAKIFIDGFLQGFDSKNPVIIINKWKDDSNEDFKGKILKDEN